MVTLPRTLSLRHARRHWARTALMVTCIALIVAAWTTTDALDRGLDAALRAAATPLAGAPDLYVNNGDAGLRADLAEQVARVPEVRAVRPILVRRVLLPGLGHQPALLLGVDLAAWRRDADASGLEVGDGASAADLKARFLGRKPVLLGRALDEELPKGAADLDVVVGGRVVRMTRVGTDEARGLASALGGYVLLTDCQVAAPLAGRPDLVDRLDVLLDPGADRDRVQEQLQALVAGSARVLTPEAHDGRVRAALAGPRVGFSLCGAGALGLGLFLVYNAMSVGVAERRREVGILRALGADRGQIWRLFLGEAAVLGMLGAGLGLPLGWGLARLCLGPMLRILSDVFLPLHAQGTGFDARTVLGGMAAGVATTLLAALVPTARAALEPPLEAMPLGALARSGAGRRVQLALALALALLALGVAGFALRGLLPAPVRTFGPLISALLGAVLAIPSASALAARLLRPLAQWSGGISGRLAADSLIRDPGRGGFAIAALAGGVALMVQTGGVIHGNEQAIRGWLDRCLAGDLFVTSGGPLSARGQTLAMREDVGLEIERSFPGTRVVPMRFRYLAWRRGEDADADGDGDGDEARVLLLALDATRYVAMNQDRSPPLPDLALYRRLAEPGTVLVSENFAALHGVVIGDTIALQGVEGPVTLRVVGTVVDYSCGRGTVMVDRARYGRLFDAEGVDVFSVALPASADAESIGRRIQQGPRAAELALRALPRPALRRHILGMVRRLYGVAYVQELVAAAVAALGVATALMVAVLQRRRELGLLRAAGATPAQVLGAVVAEAALMAIIGVLFGLLIGVPLEWYVLRVVLLEETGFVFPVWLPWGDAAMIAALMVLGGVIAGLVPAVGAARTRITEAIAYE